MKKNRFTILIALAAVAVPIFVLATPHLAYADCVSLTGFSVSDCVFGVTSWIAELGFQIAGAFLTITGVLLNGTMVATLNIAQIVNATTAIGVAWRTIRDFSGIFIIFLLLYASIKMILGMKDANLGTLIKNIIIAGLLINFSLFITKFVVDASDIASLSFYTAIAPGLSANSLNGNISSAFNDGGLSNVFMQSLDINQIASSKNALIPGGDVNTNRTITLAYVGGTVLMITAAFSFLFAAVAFAVRIGVLILLMAFSPIYFIAIMFPQVKEYGDKWRDTLIAMCLFMPVYLFLMYVAVSVINDPNFFNFAKVSTLATGNSLITAQTIGIVLQYVIAFFFINAPMLAAMKLAGNGKDIAVKWGENITKWGQGFVGRNTIGRASRGISNNETFKNVAQKSGFAGRWANQALDAGAKASFGADKNGGKGGYDAALKDLTKKKVDYGKNLSKDRFGKDRIAYQKPNSFGMTVDFDGNQSFNRHPEYRRDIDGKALKKLKNGKVIDSRDPRYNTLRADEFDYVTITKKDKYVDSLKGGYMSDRQAAKELTGKDALKEIARILQEEGAVTPPAPAAVPPATPPPAPHP